MEYWNRDDVVADLDVVEHRRSFAGPTVYRVILKVFTNNNFTVKVNEVFVWRRYSEFKKLHNNLKTVFSQTNELDDFPEFIKGKIFGRFEEHIVKERQESAANFLKYVARNPVLCRSLYVKKFFEGAVKVTHQSNSSCEEPTYLLENHDRLSVSGENMNSDFAIDAGEEELENTPLTQPRGTWNDRQPTPEPLDTNDGRDTMQYIESTEQNDERPLSGNESYAEAGSLATFSDSPKQQNTFPDTSTAWNQVVASSNSTEDDDDVFGEFEAYRDENSQWLQKAFSVCSEGEDINQLASEAGEVPSVGDVLSVGSNDAVGEVVILASGNICGVWDPDSGVNAPGEPSYEDSNSVVVPDIKAAHTNDSIDCGSSVIIDTDTTADVNEIATASGEADCDSIIQSLCDLPVLDDDANDTQPSYFNNNESSAFRTGVEECRDNESRHIDQKENQRNSQTFISDTYEIDPVNRTLNAIDSSSVNQHPSIDRSIDVNKFGALVGGTVDLPSEAEIAHHDDSTNWNVSSNRIGSDSSFDGKENPFSISLDDKLQRRIQRAIEKDDYIYQSSLAMSEAIELEEQQKYQASFKLYKLGIGLLLQGVKQDTDEGRRAAVRRKTAQYLLRAENVYKYCISQAEQKTKARGRPIRLGECRTIGIIDKIILVERVTTSEVVALKVLHKCGVEYKNRKGSNPRGGTTFINCKYMVHLYHYTESSTGIHLFLEYIPSGLLWNNLEMDLGWKSASFERKSPCLSTRYNDVDRSGPKLSILRSSSMKADSEMSNLEIPEDLIRMWIAEIVSVLSDLHKHGIVCGDLNPQNILLDEDGHIKLTYFSNIKGIDYSLHQSAITRSYAAPEARGVFPLTPAADWWSVGALLFELLTRKSLHSCYPNGIHSHSIINLPKPVSNEAWSLLAGLLRYNYKDRLGSGSDGYEEIKSHPFFASINWNDL